MQNKKRIPVSDKVDYTPWEMPDLTGVKRRIAQRLSEFEEQQTPPDEPAEALTLPSQEELAKLKEEAHQEGYSAGFAEGQAAGNEEGQALGYKTGEEAGQEAGFQAGYQSGLAQAEQEIDQQLARLQSVIEQLQGPLAALDKEVEAALLSLVDLISRAILRREIKLDRSFLTEVLKEAVAALPAGHQRLRISLNPEDLNLAEAACQDLIEDYRLIGDPEVTLGGAKIETLQSLVDSTLESRYKKIIDQLLTHAYQPSAADFEPLSNQVLNTPDADPLDEAAFTAPKASTPEQVLDTPKEADPELELESDPESESVEQKPEVAPASEVPAPETVAKVSLQRGKAPRHQQPLKPLADPTPADHPETPDKPPLDEEESPAVQANETVQASELPASDLEAQKAPEAADLTAEQAVDMKAELSEDLSATTEELPKKEEAALDLAQDELSSSETSKALKQEESSTEVADFLDEFIEEAGELELDSSSDSVAESQEEVEQATSQTPEALAEDKTADWAPKSVHDDRYLEDEEALENSWLKEMQETPSDTPLDIIPDDEQGH